MEETLTEKEHKKIKRIYYELDTKKSFSLNELEKLYLELKYAKSIGELLKEAMEKSGVISENEICKDTLLTASKVSRMLNYRKKISINHSSRFNEVELALVAQSIYSMDKQEFYDLLDELEYVNNPLKRIYDFAIKNDMEVNEIALLKECFFYDDKNDFHRRN